MARRTRNEGSIRKRADGRFEVRVQDPLTGKRRSYFTRTQQEAKNKLQSVQSEINDGLSLGDERLTVGVFLRDWLAAKKPQVRSTTYERYQYAVEGQIIPALGSVKLRKLTPAQVRKMYADLQAAGMAPRSIAKVHSVLRNALGQATRDGAVARNVASLVSPPRPDHKEMETLTGAQVAKLLEAAKGDRFEALYILAVSIGARRGELLGLKWGDVDLVEGTMQVRHTLVAVGGRVAFHEPKTARSRRQISLARAGVEALKAHRTRQLEERLAAIGWQDHDLVFPNEIGGAMNPSNFRTRSWLPVRERAGIPSIPFHNLRHTAASLTLAAGVNAKIISEMLGHSSTAMTLDVYAHTIPGMHRQAADAFDALLSRSV